MTIHQYRWLDDWRARRKKKSLTRPLARLTDVSEGGRRVTVEDLKRLGILSLK